MNITAAVVPVRSAPFFSIFKRGMVGVYQHCGEQHLHLPRRVRFPLFEPVKLGVDDTERTRRAIKGAGGKRLTYRRTRSQEKEAGAA
jgi:hypothetical protein